jgi:hypothetical protein
VIESRLFTFERLNLQVKLIHLSNALLLLLLDLSFDLVQGPQDLFIVQGLKVRRCLVIGLCYHAEGGFRYILLAIVDEVDGEGAVKVLAEEGAVLEVYVVKELHVLEDYLHSLGLVVVGKTVVFAAEDAEEALIDELGAQGVGCGIHFPVEGRLVREQKDRFYN